jgi:hypothetical protein
MHSKDDMCIRNVYNRNPPLMLEAETVLDSVSMVVDRSNSPFPHFRYQRSKGEDIKKVVISSGTYCALPALKMSCSSDEVRW